MKSSARPRGLTEDARPWAAAGPVARQSSTASAKRPAIWLLRDLLSSIEPAYARRSIDDNRFREHAGKSAATLLQPKRGRPVGDEGEDRDPILQELRLQAVRPCGVRSSSGNWRLDGAGGSDRLMHGSRFRLPGASDAQAISPGGRHTEDGVPEGNWVAVRAALG